MSSSSPSSSQVITLKNPVQQLLMPSLTARERIDEVHHEAMVESAMNGFLTLLPCIGTLIIAVKHPQTIFVNRTNWSSRTAFVVMPALLIAAITYKQKLKDKIKEFKFSIQTVQKAEQIIEQYHEESKINNNDIDSALDRFKENKQHIKELDEESKRMKGKICIVPGNQLMWYHYSANFIANHPMKIISSLSIPSIAWIFYVPYTGKLLPSLVYPRVFRTLITIPILVSVVGFKVFMDRDGLFISEVHGRERVLNKELINQQLLFYQLQYDLLLQKQIYEKLKIAIQREDDMMSDIIIQMKEGTSISTLKSISKYISYKIKSILFK